MPFVELSSSQWTPFLETGLHDLYHLPEYAALDAKWMKGEALGWIYTNDDCRCLIPLIHRSINRACPEISSDTSEVNSSFPTKHLPGGQFYDLVSPYGYPGILSLKPLTAGEVSLVLSSFQAEAATAGYISSFIRLHPFLNNWILPSMYGMPDFHQCNHGLTLSIDLKVLNCNTSDQFHFDEHLMDNFSLNHRRNLRHLHQEGFTTEINAWNYLPDFLAAYTSTMIRRKAAPRYLFTENYFSRLRCIAGEHLYFIAVLSPDLEFCCGGLFSHFNRTMQYLFGATVESALNHSPSKLMMEEAISLGINHGAEVLHLGGGVGAGVADGVFRFKQGFAHRRHAFQCLHFIHRPEIYHRLVHEQREVLAKNQPMLFVAEDSMTYGDHPQFFPSYRTSDD